MPAKSAKQYKDFIWLAAIFEGEGTFRINDDGTAPVMSVGMVDIDIISRVASIIDGKIYTEKLKSGNIFYKTSLFGNLAIQWMMTIYCLLGIRRQSKIKDILLKWKLNIPKRIGPQLKYACKRGHEFTEENTYINRNGNRICKECRRIHDFNRGRTSLTNTIAFIKYSEEKKVG